jgi:hypothetical protein
VVVVFLDAGDGDYGGTPEMEARMPRAAVEAAEQALELRVSGWGRRGLRVWGEGRRRRIRGGCRKGGRSLEPTAADLGEPSAVGREEEERRDVGGLWPTTIACVRRIPVPPL